MSEPRALLAVTPIETKAFVRWLPPALADRFRIHVINRLEPSMASITSTIREAAAEIAPGEAVLFGHSMNGSLVLAAAAAGAACAGVIAVGAPPRLPSDLTLSSAYWEEHAEAHRLELAAEIVAAHEGATDDAERMKHRERYDRLRRWYDTSFDPTDLQRDVVIDLEWVQAVFDDAGSVDWSATTRAVECPVLLALGAYDFVSPPTAWTPANTPPHATIERFERSGHTPFVEEPAVFLDAVDRWLAAAALSPTS